MRESRKVSRRTGHPEHMETEEVAEDQYHNTSRQTKCSRSLTKENGAAVDPCDKTLEKSRVFTRVHSCHTSYYTCPQLLTRVRKIERLWTPMISCIEEDMSIEDDMRLMCLS